MPSLNTDAQSTDGVDDEAGSGDHATTDPPSSTSRGSSARRSCTQIPAVSPINPANANAPPSGDQGVIACANCP